MQTYRLKGASGAVANQAFNLRQRTLIGRADDCDLRPEDEACAAHHCTIELRDGPMLELTHTATDADFETRVNGEVVERTVLAAGDEIRIGSCRWVVQAPGLRPERVLTDEAVRPRRRWWPWLLVVLIAAAAALAWYQGWVVLPI